MEKAHVLIRLCDFEREQMRKSRDTEDGNQSPPRGTSFGVCRTSATTVRLEQSNLSKGTTSFSFDQVFDEQHSIADIFKHSLAGAIDKVVGDGSAMTVVTTGASQSGELHCMHSDGSGTKAVGLVELAIQRVFACLADCDEWQVLLGVVYTDAKESDTFVDAITGEQVKCDPHDNSMHDGALLTRTVRVGSANEATLAYRRASQRSRKQDGMIDMAVDLACVFFVESRAKSGEIRRGRFVCIDVHGCGIIEPVTVDNQQEESRSTLFADTGLRVNQRLTKCFGWFLGNESATFLIVMIPKSANKLQQAIQSLFYACKATEIKSSPVLRKIDLFTARPAFNSVEIYVSEAEYPGDKLVLGSPASQTLTSSSCSAATRSSSDILSERLRQAYQSVKKGSRTARSSPRMSPPSLRVHTSIETSPNPTVTMQTLHALADAILHQERSDKKKMKAMTLHEKLDKIAVQQAELEKALRQEVSIKEKCVDRISKLSQTMNFQVTENEKQLKLRDEENETLKAQLQGMQSKYDTAEDTLEKLQEQVEAMKMAARDRSATRSPSKAFHERGLLQQFSSRLETAMMEAKAVVDHKDSVILELERRNAQLQGINDTIEKDLSVLKTQFRAESSQWRTIQNQWEQEKAELLKNQDQKVEDITRLQEANSRLEGERARLLVARSAGDEDKLLWTKKQAEFEEEMTYKIAELDDERARWLIVRSALIEEQDNLRAELKDREEESRRRELEHMKSKTTWSDKEALWNDERAHLLVDKTKHADEIAAAKAALNEYQLQIKNRDKESTEQAAKLAQVQQDLAAKTIALEEQLRIAHVELTMRQNEEASNLEIEVARLEALLESREIETEDAKATRAAMEAAKVSAETQASDLTAELNDTRLLFAKEIKKLEKKLRILMNERKQQLDEAEKLEGEMAREAQRLGLELKALEVEKQRVVAERDHLMVRVINHEARVNDLSNQHTVSQEELKVMRNCVQQLEKDKAAVEEELNRRTYDLEQRTARRLVEREAQLASEYECKLRDTMDRHASELLQRDLELRKLRIRRAAPKFPVETTETSPSPSSSPSSASSGEQFQHQQYDLDQLDTVVGGQMSKDKRLERKLAKQKQKIAQLREHGKSLTHALAISNEQESMAKDAIEKQQAFYERMMYAQDELQTQVNALKEENWVLNLVLQITEKRGHSKTPDLLPCPQIAEY